MTTHTIDAETLSEFFHPPVPRLEDPSHYDRQEDQVNASGRALGLKDTWNLTPEELSDYFAELYLPSVATQKETTSLLSREVVLSFCNQMERLHALRRAKILPPAMIMLAQQRCDEMISLVDANERPPFSTEELRDVELYLSASWLLLKIVRMTTRE